MCCSANGPGDELERSLAKLVELLDDRRFDHVVVETSGLANPGPLISMLFSSKMARSKYVLDGVVAVVDCKHIMWHLGAEQQVNGTLGSTAMKWVLSGAPRTIEAQHQLLAADVILLNKTDLVTTEQLQAVQGALADLNSCARLMQCQHGMVDTADLLALEAFDLASVEPSNLRSGAFGYNALATLSGEHSSQTGSTTLTLPHGAVLRQTELMKWLQSTLRQHWKQLYRVKGILPVRCVDSGAVRSFVVQGVHAELFGEFSDGPAPPTEEEMPTCSPRADDVHSEWMPAEDSSHHSSTITRAHVPGGNDAAHEPVLVLIGQDIQSSQRQDWQQQLLSCCEMCE